MTTTLPANIYSDNKTFHASNFYNSTTYSGIPINGSIWTSASRDEPGRNTSSTDRQRDGSWGAPQKLGLNSTKSSQRQNTLSLILPPVKANNRSFGINNDRTSPTANNGSSTIQGEPYSAHSRSNNESTLPTPNSVTSSTDHFSHASHTNSDSKLQYSSSARGAQEQMSTWIAAKEFRPSMPVSQPRVASSGSQETSRLFSAPETLPFGRSSTLPSASNQRDQMGTRGVQLKPSEFRPVLNLQTPYAVTRDSSHYDANGGKSAVDQSSITGALSRLRFDRWDPMYKQEYFYHPSSRSAILPQQNVPYSQQDYGRDGLPSWDSNYMLATRSQHPQGSSGARAPEASVKASSSTANMDFFQTLSYNTARVSSYNDQVLSRSLRPSPHDHYKIDEYVHEQHVPFPSQSYGNVLYPNDHMNFHNGNYTIDSSTSLPYMISEPLSDRQQDSNHVYRSPLLEEFRVNKARKFELKDIYDHIVEFSGDQLGSRFIQQKLEVANSDEKDRVFSEIACDSRQLMTDVFGNYVIQKLFEHGNQSQKKLLASHMKGHIYALSTQTYGCRVVQKALEHILTDQQATLIRELDGCVLKVVENQNGNHVIQKAIERVPGEHIQFIVDAHRGHVHYLSKHGYGCRVIQRMLEHCTPRAKRQILDELHLNMSDLIQDAFGNYVVQHVIVNGEAQDRKPVIDKVLSNLLENAQHKFASNVVEKALDYADEEQCRAMLRMLNGCDEEGKSQVLRLLSHQYGNYVIQKSAAHLHGQPLASLIDDMEQYLGTLRRISTGKQVAALEKTIRDARQRLNTCSQRYDNGIHNALIQPRMSFPRR